MTVKFAEGEWKPDGPIVWPVGLLELDMQNGLWEVESSFGSSSYLFKYEDTLEVLPSLATYAAANRDVVTFSAPHGLEVGDVIGFRNTTPSSLNAWRSTYYDGQQTTVREIVSDTEITCWDMIDPRGALKVFPAGTEMVRYRRRSCGLALRNVNIEAGLNLTSPILMRGMSHFELENIRANGGVHAACVLSLAAYGRSEGLVLGQYGPVVSTQYGLSHDAVSFHKTFGTVAYATRHAIHHGNNDGVGALPPRGNEHYGVTLGARDSEALDFGHGNILDHRCIGGTITGVGIGGSNNHVDVDVITTNAVSAQQAGNAAIIGTNMHDMNHKVRAGRIVVAGDGKQSGTTFARGIIGFGGTGNVFNANTVDGGVLDIEVGAIEARYWNDASAMLTRFRNRGFAGLWGIKLRIGEIVCPVEANWFSMANVGGSAPSILDIAQEPMRTDPSATPTHGWNSSTKGIEGAGVASGGQLQRPRITNGVTLSSASLAGGATANFDVTGFVGLNAADILDWSVSTAPGAIVVSPVLLNSTTVRLVLYNPGAGVTLPAATWYAHVTKRT